MGNHIVKDVSVPVAEPVKVLTKKPSNVTILPFVCGELTIEHIPEWIDFEELSDYDLKKSGLVVPNGDMDVYLQILIDVLAECRYKFRLVPGREKSVVHIYKPKMANKNIEHFKMRSNVSLLIVRMTGYYNQV